MVLSPTCHSRARGNPGSFFGRINLDTRFRGYDGTQEPLQSTSTPIFKEEYEGHEVQSFVA